MYYTVTILLFSRNLAGFIAIPTINISFVLDFAARAFPPDLRISFGAKGRPGSKARSPFFQTNWKERKLLFNLRRQIWYDIHSAGLVPETSPTRTLEERLVMVGVCTASRGAAREAINSLDIIPNPR